MCGGGSKDNFCVNQHRTAVIGLGVMGQRMLGNMEKYAGFEPVVVWDPDADACAETQARYPQLRVAKTAGEAVAGADIDCVYIACPPQFHAEHALSAFAAGKAVWCEKPLGVDEVQSAELAAAAERSGQVHIVNFSLANAIATAELEAALASNDLGDLQHVDLRLHFARWPRDWQAAAAGWLAYRHEGGFTREVVSHWVYLTARAMSMPKLQFARCRYPEGNLAETHLLAMLDVEGLPFSISASTGGVGPDIIEYTVQGSKRGFRVRDWNVPLVSDGENWVACRDDVAVPRETGYEMQLKNAARAVAGESHGMPDFHMALEVQRVVEAMLGVGRG